MIIAACGGESPTGSIRPVPGDPAPLYGSCNENPNYADEVRLNRWRSFPLTYYFDAGTFPQEFLGDYRSVITEGITSWDAATEDDLGAVVEVTNSGAADFVIMYGEFEPPFTARTIHATGTPYLSGGRIEFNRLGMREGEEFVRDGVISREAFLRGIRGIAAHEMGHLLGIIGHPRWTDVLMGPRFYDVPSVADVNTLSQGYCR